MNDTIISTSDYTAIADARAYAKRWSGPKSEEEWRALGIEPFRIFEELKWELQEQLSPVDFHWGGACRAIAREVGL